MFTKDNFPDVPVEISRDLNTKPCGLLDLHAGLTLMPLACFFPNRSVKQREDILTSKLAADTHVIVRKTQIAQRAAINNW